MSESSDPIGLPGNSASGQHPPTADSAGSAARRPAPGRGMDDDVAREVEAAMAAMSDTEIAELTGEVPDQGQGATSGSRRRGRIVGIYEDDVFIDLGGKSQGVVPRAQFGKEEVLEIGIEVEVFIERYDADSGLLLTSRDGAVRE